MRQLTAEGQRVTEDLAQRYGVSVDAVVTLLHSLAAGGGTMAQFSHPDLGGMGQWSQGGMIMVGDMFNNALKAKVDGLCSELSALLGREPLFARPVAAQSQSQSQGGGGFASGGGFGDVSLFVPQAGGGGGGWWPPELGTPSSVGSQNDIRYAVFPATRRLAVQIGDRTKIYDTLDHQIGGVSQQQSGDASLTFTSQYGLVRVSALPVVEPETAASPAPQAAPSSVSAPAPAPAAPAAPAPTIPTAEPAAEPAAEPVAEASPPKPESALCVPDTGAAKAPPSAPTPAPPSAPTPAKAPAPEAAASPVSADDIFAKIERLADLRGKGILSDEEFAAKKAELLDRL